jgi:hypothetical protein
VGPSSDLTAKARDLSDRGLRQYQTGDFEAAIESFLAAYALSNRPALLFNVAQAYRLTGDCGRAAEYYRRYLGADVDQGLRASIEKRLAEMETCLRRQDVRDGAVASFAVTAMPVPAGAAPNAAHQLTISPAVSKPEEATPKSRQPRVIAFVGSAVVLGAVGTFLEMHARSAEADLSNRYAAGGTWDDAAQQRLDEGNRDRVLAISSFVIAALSAAIGVWSGLRRSP